MFVETVKKANTVGRLLQMTCTIHMYEMRSKIICYFKFFQKVFLNPTLDTLLKSALWYHQQFLYRFFFYLLNNWALV